MVNVAWVIKPYLLLLILQSDIQEHSKCDMNVPVQENAMSNGPRSNGYHHGLVLRKQYKNKCKENQINLCKFQQGSP